MELLHTNQVSYDELFKEQFDIVFAACDYQAGCGQLVKMSGFNSKRKIALIIKEGLNDLKKNENIALLTEKGFECLEISGTSVTEIKDVLATTCHSQTCENVKLVVDYSSMTKFWYGTIINYFALHEMLCKNLIVYFCYTPEHYLPKAASKSKFCTPQPLIMHENSRTQNKPVALIVGLGTDAEKAEFLSDFFKPQELHLFKPDVTVDNEQAKSFKELNKKLLSKFKPSHIHNYSANNIEDIDVQLRSICLSLRLKHRVILVSLGPKTFSLASFLINARYPDVEIWTLCAQANEYGLKAADVPVVYKAVLTSIDDDYD